MRFEWQQEDMFRRRAVGKIVGWNVELSSFSTPHASHVVATLTSDSGMVVTVKTPVALDLIIEDEAEQLGRRIAYFMGREVSPRSAE